MKRVALLWVLCASLVACFGGGGGHPQEVAFPETVHKRAAFDLGCPAEQVQVQDIGGSSYGAMGCGKKASYTCVCMWHVWSDCTKVACTLDGATDPGAPPPPAGGAH